MMSVAYLRSEPLERWPLQVGATVALRSVFPPAKNWIEVEDDGKNRVTS